MAPTSVVCTDSQLLVFSLVSSEICSRSNKLNISLGLVDVGQCNPISKDRILDLGKEISSSFSCERGGNTPLIIGCFYLIFSNSF